MFTNESSCDVQVIVDYGNTTGCGIGVGGVPWCYSLPSTWCDSLNIWVTDCCSCPAPSLGFPFCECELAAIPLYQCAGTSSATYFLAANSQLQITPPNTVCMFRIVDAASPTPNWLLDCRCSECAECYDQVFVPSCSQTVEIDVTAGWTIKVRDL